MSEPPPDPIASAPACAGAPADRTQWFLDEVHPQSGPLTSYLRSSFPSVRDVEDLVQESYLRVWKAHAIQPIRSAKAFLFAVARRLALDTVRREQRSPIVGVTDLDQLFVLNNAPDAAETAARSQEIELLAEAVDSLPARCREIFLLRRIEGISQKEIAARLRLSEQTVQVQAARGLRKIDAFMKRRLKERL